MEQERKLKLLLRQLKDIQAQADSILIGEKSYERVEAFARYSGDMKEYVFKNIESEEIKSYSRDMPDINYSRMELKLWYILIFPAWWVYLFKDYIARNSAIREINMVRGRYSNLELLIKGIIND